MLEIKQILELCITLMLFPIYLSLSSQSPDFILLPNEKGRPINSALLNDETSLLVIGNNFHFSLKFDGTPEVSPLIAPDFLNSKLSSTVKRVMNGQIIMVCGVQHFSMFNEDNAETIHYTGIGSFNSDLMCSLNEIEQNLFLFAYSDTANYHIEIIQYNDDPKEFTNLYYDKFTAYEGIIVCNIFVNPEIILCVYHRSNDLKGQLYNMDLTKNGAEIPAVLSLFKMYRLFRADDQTILLFGSLNGIFSGKVLTYDTSFDKSKPTKSIINFGSILQFMQLDITPLSESIILLMIRTTGVFYIQKCTYSIDLIGIKTAFGQKPGLMHVGIQPYNSYSFVIFASVTDTSNFVYFVTDPKCNNKEYYININQSIELTGLVDELSPVIKQYMVVYKKNPAVIAENPAIALKSAKNIEIFTFQLTDMGIFKYSYYIMEDMNQEVISALCTLTLIVCFESCKECSQTDIGSISNNQCTECNTGYFFDVTNPTNCLLGCDPTINYHYYDEKYIAQCAIGMACPDDYAYLIENTLQCTSNCLKHGLLTDLQNNKCVPTCPEGSFYNKTDSTCLESIECPPEKFPSLAQKGCVTIEILEKEMQNIMKDLENNILYLIENYKNLTIKDSTFQIYNTSDEGIKEANGHNNLSKIHLGPCEAILRRIYDIPVDEVLIIFKKDTIVPGSITNKVEYAVFSLYGYRLDLDLCDLTPITITIPVSDVTLNDYTTAKDLDSIGVNVFDNEDPFFNDMCFPYAKDNTTDMPRCDRVKEILLDNTTLCPNGCVFKGIDYQKNLTRCTCTEITDSIPESPIVLIKDSIMDSLTRANWEVIFCYRLVFTIDIFPENVGNWFIISVSLLFTINTCWFFGKLAKPLKSYLMELHNASIRRSSIMTHTKSRRTSIQDIDSVICSTPALIKNPNLNKTETQEPQQETKQPQIYTIEQYASMSYEELLIKDKRNCVQHYFSFVALTHPLINAFFTPSRKELRTIKISLFFIVIAIDFTLNAFFYSDEYISNNYNNGGVVDFLYNLPISIYSYLFGICLTFTLNKLSNAESEMSKIEKQKTPQHQLMKIRKFIRCYKIKLFFFFFFQGILLILFWYYTTAFCSVFTNSQIEWLKSGLISNAMTQGIPFIFSLLYTLMMELTLRYKLRWGYKLINLVLSLM